MEAQLKKAYIQEVKYQTQLLNRLKGWLKSTILFSSVSLILIIFGPSIHSFVKPLGIVLMIISVIAAIIIGLGIKRGQENVSKIIDYIEK